MSFLADAVSGLRAVTGGSRSMSIEDIAKVIGANLLTPQTYVGAKRDEPDGTFPSVASLLSTNPIVYACHQVRSEVFALAAFRFQQLRQGLPGALFGSPELALLETPWPGGTTQELLQRMLVYADLAGNAYVVRRQNRLRVLRPDWITIVMGSRQDPDVSAWDIDADVLGYVYQPGGRGSGKEPESLLPGDVAHFKLLPAPMTPFRGMSWISSVIDDVQADDAATNHKLGTFENGAALKYVVTFDPTVKKEAFDAFRAAFKEQHEGSLNAYKTLFLGAGADIKLVESTLEDMTFREVQGAGETRIAAAAGVPPVLAGFSEGLNAATYSNYSQARRRFADATMRPLWEKAAASLAHLITIPAAARLWYDEDRIAFLREDEKEQAEILGQLAASIRQLTDGGYIADAVIDAVVAGDLSRLSGNHTGYLPVQVQPVKPDPNVENQPRMALPGGYLELPETTVTSEAVQAKRDELLATGCDAGYGTLARLFNVSEATIRRRLGAI